MPDQGKVPGGGTHYVVNGKHVVVYELGTGLKVSYDIPAGQVPAGLGPEQAISPDQYNHLSAMPMVQGGSITELFGIKEATFGEWFDKQLKLVTGNADWVNDPQVRSIFSNWLVNPEVSAEEIQGQLRQTEYWKNHTAAENAYNSASPADQGRMDNEAAASLANRYFQMTGIAISAWDPDLHKYAQMIARGAQTENTIVEIWVKPQAVKNPNSPWSRSLREEDESQRQRGVDIGNQREQVRELYDRWGVPLSDQTADDLARQITEKRMAQGDLEHLVQTQAQQLYPWKDPQIETRTAAEPWMQTYSRVLEKPAQSLFDPKIQKALSAGTPVYQFEQQLKQEPEWLQTKNAMDDLTTTASSIGKQMGFL